eukprot:scaffold4189_cov378-Prasinococcus_capsulatus_cf.AAC.10
MDSEDDARSCSDGEDWLEAIWGDLSACTRATLKGEYSWLCMGDALAGLDGETMGDPRGELRPWYALPDASAVGCRRRLCCFSELRASRVSTTREEPELSAPLLFFISGEVSPPGRARARSAFLDAGGHRPSQL